MSKWSKKDTSKYTGDSTRKVSRAEHDARNHAAGSGHLEERNRNKVRDSPNGGLLYEILKNIGFGGRKRR